jgi:hypothetical protein
MYQFIKYKKRVAGVIINGTNHNNLDFPGDNSPGLQCPKGQFGELLVNLVCFSVSLSVCLSVYHYIAIVSFQIEGDKTYQYDKDYIDLHGFQLNSTQMRRKRSTIPSSYRSTNAVGCREDENYCVEINCTLKSSVPANADIKVVLYARLVAKTVAKYTEAPPTAASRLVAWFNSSYFYNPRPFTATVRSRLSPDQVEEYFDCVPVWVVIGSVIGGVVILAIIILILFYCGFFKTKRHGSMTVTADEEIRWKTAAPTLQTPEGGTVASETVTNNNEYRTDKPSYENHPMHEHEALRSESEESDDSVKKMPLNGTEQTTV